MSDGSTQVVTSSATWQSSNAGVATVSGSGLVTAVAAGETDIRATYQGVTVVLHIAVAPVSRATLLGIVIDSGTLRPLSGVVVSIIDGSNGGQSAVTDGNGYYSLGQLLEGTFTLQLTKTGYTTVSRSVTLTSDLRLDVSITQL
jgi:hypothetical protein